MECGTLRLRRDDRDKFFLYTKVEGNFVKWYGGLTSRNFNQYGAKKNINPLGFKIVDDVTGAEAFPYMTHAEPVLKYLHQKTDYKWETTTQREIGTQRKHEHCINNSGVDAWLPIEREFIQSDYHPLIEEQIPITSAWFSESRRPKLINTINEIVRCNDCNGWMYSKKKTCERCLTVRRKKRQSNKGWR